MGEYNKTNDRGHDTKIIPAEDLGRLRGEIKYLDLMRNILKNGDVKDPARENMPRTKELFGETIRFDLNLAFPLLTTKKMHTRGIVEELLFFLNGKVTIDKLKEKGVHIWDSDVKRWDKESESILGKGYPHLWRRWGSDKLSGYPDKTPVDIKLCDVDSTNHEVHKTNSYGDYIVLLDNIPNKSGYSRIQFISTGYELDVRKGRIKERLDFYDPYYPSKHGIACIGLPNTNIDNFGKIKNLWNAMIDRCYCENHEHYMYYGGRGVRVSKRWKCLEYFMDDISKVKNWDLKNENWNKYELDKDIKGCGLLYSTTSCMFITKTENIHKKSERYTYTVAKQGLEKETHEFRITSEFMKKHGIKNQGNFNSMLRGERGICEGWVLMKKVDNHLGDDQILNLLNLIITNPNSRYQIVSAWDPSIIQNNDVALPSCHVFWQTNVREGKYLDMLMLQRSCDYFLGVPYNIASYAILNHLLCLLTGYEPGVFTWFGGSVHIYENQVDACHEQLSRKPTSPPTLKINTNRVNHWIEEGKTNGYTSELLNSIFNELKFEDFIFEHYEPQSAIKAPLSTGWLELNNYKQKW